MICQHGFTALHVNKSVIFYNNTKTIVSDYNDYIITLFKRILENNPVSINLYFAPFTGDPCTCCIDRSDSPIVRIDCNYEHTLVKPGGRDSNQSYNSYFNNYLVRLVNYEGLSKSDIVIDYSIQNIQNIECSAKYDQVRDKMICIYPAIYKEHKFALQHPPLRHTQCLTTFFDEKQPRRKMLLEKLQKMQIQHINVNKCFDAQALQNLYLSTKILVNIHQTDHHHTLEELRILPALQCGVIVISEKTEINEYPLMDVAYNDYIIWASYDEIMDKLQDVLQNYDKYFHEIFQTPKKFSLFDLDQENYNTLEKKILEKII